MVGNQIRNEGEKEKRCVREKSIVCPRAHEQLSVIKIYFKESQITLCTKGKGLRSGARQGKRGNWREGGGVGGSSEKTERAFNRKNRSWSNALAA